MTRDSHAHNLTDEQAETVYALGHSAYEHGEYSKAATIFGGLAATKQKNYKYWMSLGAAQQMLKKYDKSAQAFLFAAALKPKEPEAYIRAAESLWHQGSREEALQTLQTAETVAKRDEALYENLLNQLALYKKAWANEKKTAVERN